MPLRLVPALLLSALVALVSSSCTKEKFEPSGLEKTVLKMEHKYTRDFASNDYSLHYVSKPPNTVVMVVKYKQRANMQMIRTVLDSAKQLVQEIAINENKMQSVNVEVEMTLVPDSETSTKN